MREHLYRGKVTEDYSDKNDEKITWIYGYLSSRDVIREKEEADGYTTHEPYFVDPETVGEWTGLLDCKGQKIFEGDIIKVRGVLNVIKYEPCSFIITSAKGKSVDLILSQGLLDKNPMEVIGNRFDDLEFLELIRK